MASGGDILIHLGEESMRIQFEMFGGYGGLFVRDPLRYTVNVDDAPEPIRTRLQALLEQSGLLDPQAPEPVTPHPDALVYRLLLSGEKAVRSLAFDDKTVPPAARPLLQYLQELAIAARGRRAGGS